jgi:hypothetical protein
MPIVKPVSGVPSFLRLLAGTAVLIVCAFFPGSHLRRAAPLGSAQQRMEAAPRVILWSWERPDDLRFIDPRRIGISFLAGTLRLEADDAFFRPRRNSFYFPPGVFLMACVRIEPQRSKELTLSAAQRAQAVQILAHVAALRGVSALQVDFDAVASERAFYAGMLSELRKDLPASIPISMTALASWCLGDDWISGLPVDEAVPMLFRMGPDRASVVSHLNDGGDFRPAVCRESLGLSTDEPLASLPTARRIYIFSNGRWTPGAVERAVAEFRGAR